MKNIHTLLLAIACCSPVASAAILLDQPLAPVDARTSSYFNTNSFQTWDRITLGTNVGVTRMSWVGAFLDATNPANNPAPPTGVSWDVQLASDSAGAPGSVTDSRSFVFSSVQAGLLGSASIAGQPVNVYRFTTDVQELLINGNQPMWLSIYATQQNAQPIFAWISGSGGDGVAKQYLFNGTFVGNYTDRALTLEGNALPEPGSMALLGLGMVLLVAGRRVRR